MSNHLGDTNKMVDTPRTEAELNRQKCWSDDLVTIDANFTCQLERELNAANAEIERLTNKVAQLYEGAEEQKQRIQSLIAERDTARLQTDQKHSLREEFRELLGTDDIEVGVAVVREMRRRIKRLKEALDLVRPHCDSVHHSKKHQHQYGEPCPVVALIENAKEAKL
jgi:predicted RNase H-like nuclease (RuvC/YqgF family)